MHIPATQRDRVFEADTYAKITWRLLPLLFCCYVISYLDRVNVGFAKLQMATSLGFSETVYGLGSGIFFIGYFLFEVPSNVILHRVGARLWITRIMVTWGILSAGNAFVNTPMQFYMLRFFLGVAEAGFFPGILLYLTYWYPTDRCGRATALFMTAVPLTGVIGGPISGWILQALDGTHGLAGWQWLFIAEAMPALVASVLVWRILDNRPLDASWLNAQEKALLHRNLQSDHYLTRTESIRTAAGQPQLWVFCAIYFSLVVGLYGVGFWLPTIIRATGVTNALHIGLLIAIPYAVATAVMIFVSHRSYRLQERRWYVASSALVGAAGLFASVAVAHSTALSIVAMTFATAGIITALPLFWSLPSTHLVGLAAAAGLAMINSVGNLGGFVGPFILGLLSSDQYGTKSGVALLAVFLLVGAALALTLPHTPRTTSSRDV
jgi:hypothetical protein